MVLWAPETAGPWSAVTIRHISMNWQAYLGNLHTKKEKTMVVWFKDFLRVSRNCWVKRPTFSGTTEAPEFLPSLFPTWRPQWWACLHRWAPDPSHHRYWSWRKQAYGLDPAPAGQTDARRKKRTNFTLCTQWDPFISLYNNMICFSYAFIWAKPLIHTDHSLAPKNNPLAQWEEASLQLAG